MRFAFDRDQELFRDAVHDVLVRECPPSLVRASWSDRSAAHGLWHTLVGIGVVGLTVPEEHGGLGRGALDGVLLLEECGRFAAPVPLGETIAVAVPLIREAGDEAFQARWLPAIAKGEARVAVGIGGEPFVRDADLADLVIVAEAKGLRVVEKSQLRPSEKPSVDRSRHLFAISPASTASERTRSFDRAALATSAELLGLAARMIEITVDYAKVRKQFGAAIGSFQAVKHHLATALMKLELARPAVYRAAHSLDHADPATSLHVSMAKACSGDAATFAARVALQCHGAIGYSFEHDLHLWMKRAWALSAAYGDASWHRERVARVGRGLASFVRCRRRR